MKLDKMKMPGKKKPPMDDYAVMELEGEPGADGMDEPAGDDAGEFQGEAEGEVGAEPDAGSSNPKLEAVSDEDLLAELKKRGLSDKLQG